MEKRYQVFISSTFTDLEDERQRVYQSILEMDCIPAGMELFPALDQEQFNFIKKIIDDSDYYILIIGGRYGSISPTGVSYTEMEYDYAVSKGIKVIALLHGSPESIPAGKTERSSEGIDKLNKFREKAATGRLVKTWTTADQLPGLVTTSLNRTIRTYPATGWVRGNIADTTALLTQINELRLENERLRSQSANSKISVSREDNATFNGEEFIRLNYIINGNSSYKFIEVKSREIFLAIGYLILSKQDMSEIYSRMVSFVARRAGIEDRYISIDYSDVDGFGLSLYSYGVIDFYESNSTSEGPALWKITPYGISVLVSLNKEAKSLA